MEEGKGEREKDFKDMPRLGTLAFWGFIIILGMVALGFALGYQIGENFVTKFYESQLEDCMNKLKPWNYALNFTNS